MAIGLVSAMCFGTSGTFGTALIGGGLVARGGGVRAGPGRGPGADGPGLLALRGRWRVLLRSAWQMTVYGLVGVAACQVCYFNAIARMPVGISIMLEYMGIVLIVAGCGLRHGQRPRPLTIGGGVAALGGLALMLNLSGSGRREPHRRDLRAGGGGVDGGVLFPVGADGSGGLPPLVLTWGGMVGRGQAASLVVLTWGVTGWGGCGSPAAP